MGWRIASNIPENINYIGYRAHDFVPIWGEGHNLYPQEVYNTVSDNKLLPEILQKQVEFLFGRGPYLYTTITEGEGKNKKQVLKR